MNIKRWLFPVVTLALALVTVGVGTGFALAGDGSSDNPAIPNDTDTAGQVSDGLPSYDEEMLDFGDGIGDGKVVTSIDDIDPNVCNAIHNINACTLEELDELGMAPVTGSIKVGECNSVPNEEANTEPLFPDDEPQYEVQPYEEAVIQDCNLAGGNVYFTSDGEVGCDIVHDLEDSGVGETQAQPPAILPEPEVLPSAV